LQSLIGSSIVYNQHTTLRSLSEDDLMVRLLSQNFYRRITSKLKIALPILLWY